MLNLAILEPFLCMHVTRRIKQSYVKETFEDNRIEALISDHDQTHTKWRGTIDLLANLL